MSTILEMKNISKEFYGVKALQDINLKILQGEIHAIVGENGAGKSTLMKILSGVYKPTSGEFFYKKEHVEFKSPKDAQIDGISIIYQEFSLVPYLNAVDNIFLGRELKKTDGLLDRATMRKEAENIMDKLGAEMDLSIPVNHLSVANQQFIEIAKALSIETNVLIFDEPTASLTGKEIDKLFDLISTLKKQGVTILYISHHLEEVFEIADRYTCLRDGALVATKHVKESNQNEMIRLMVGRDISNHFPKKEVANFDDAEVILRVNNLTNENIKDINFKVKKGEVVGIAGLVGAGRTEMARALIGADKTHISNIEINDEKVKIKTPIDALKNGIGLIPESRKTQGLVTDLSIRENISTTILDRLANNLNLIDRKREREVIEKSIKDLRIITPSMNQKVRNLSGGNQQKVVLAKWLNVKLNVLIFDEPTRGIDVGAKEEIYSLIRKLTDEGLGVILISSELPEVMGLSDRILVMQKGRIVGELDGSETTQEEVMYYCTGGENNNAKIG